jgi:hypothetical protein
MTPIRASSAGGSGAQPDRSSTHFVRLIASAADHFARMTEKQTPAGGCWPTGVRRMDGMRGLGGSRCHAKDPRSYPSARTWVQASSSNEQNRTEYRKNLPNGAQSCATADSLEWKNFNCVELRAAFCLAGLALAAGMVGAAVGSKGLNACFSHSSIMTDSREPM